MTSEAQPHVDGHRKAIETQEEEQAQWIHEQTTGGEEEQQLVAEVVHGEQHSHGLDKEYGTELPVHQANALVQLLEE